MKSEANLFSSVTFLHPHKTNNPLPDYISVQLKLNSRCFFGFFSLYLRKLLLKSEVFLFEKQEFNFNISDFNSLQTRWYLLVSWLLVFQIFIIAKSLTL